MATRRNTESENLTPANLDKVIKLLEADKPITKKTACEILGIAYNTTRLGTLIEKYKEDRRREAERRAANRGKPATPGEISFAVSSYLEGATIDHISNALYRSTDFVKRVLDMAGVPLRQTSHDYFNPSVIPDSAVRERFKIGEIVYSTRYDSIAKIEGESPHPDGWVYRLWLRSERWQQFAYQPASELASLEHLKQLGVEFK